MYSKVYSYHEDTAGLVLTTLPSYHSICFCQPTMTQVSLSPMIGIDDEKSLRLREAKIEAQAKVGVITMPVAEEEVGSSDDDDALKLAGSHAHNFDEDYYLRLRRKIVSDSELKHQ